jgi:hypothetical protein
MCACVEYISEQEAGVNENSTVILTFMKMPKLIDYWSELSLTFGI